MVISILSRERRLPLLHRVSMNLLDTKYVKIIITIPYYPLSDHLLVHHLCQSLPTHQSTWIFLKLSFFDQRNLHILRQDVQ